MDAKFTKGPYEAIEAEDEAMIGNEAYASHLIVTVDKTIHEGASHVVVGAVAHIEHEVFDRIGTSEGNAKLWAAAPELYAYAVCEQAIWSNTAPADCDAILAKHGYRPEKHKCPGDFVDELRRAGLAKAT